jgi:hypothetical protein
MRRNTVRIFLVRHICKLEKIYRITKLENRRLNKNCKIDRKRIIPGFGSTSRSLVHFCSQPLCKMMICARIQTDGVAIISNNSRLTHCDDCEGFYIPPDRQKMLANDLFVAAATVVEKGNKQFHQIEVLVAYHFESEICPVMCSRLTADLRLRTAWTGWEEGFARVRCLVGNFVAENPGSVYEQTVSEDTKFQSLVLIPAQSLHIVRSSGRWYYGLDTCFSRKKNNKCQVYVFETTDGNNVSVPLAIDIFATESAANYISFITAIKSLGGGEMGRLIDDPNCVVCTDRHLSISPALLHCLPHARHRYDVHHIMQNMHGESWKTTDGDFMNCHKEVHKKDFDVLMSAWKIKHVLDVVYSLCTWRRILPAQPHRQPTG